MFAIPDEKNSDVDICHHQTLKIAYTQPTLLLLLFFAIYVNQSKGETGKVPVLRLHGISPMALTIPPNPQVAMYGQYVATGGKSYSEFHQWPSVDHWCKTLGHRWKLTNYKHFCWKFCYNVFQKSNYAIKMSNSTIFEYIDAGLVSNDAAG